MNRLMTPKLAFRKAVGGDASRVTALVNSAYRGDSSRAGWTTEADLLEGIRTGENEVRDLISGPGSMILLCVREGEIVGSVHLRREGTGAYLGLFVVEPSLQGGGIGKEFMRAAEDLVRREWAAKKMTMTVITLRHELIAFYERRGYRRTGERTPWPEGESRSTPQVPGLEFEVLEKDLGA